MDRYLLLALQVLLELANVILDLLKLPQLQIVLARLVTLQLPKLLLLFAVLLLPKFIMEITDVLVQLDTQNSQPAQMLSCVATTYRF